jgi:hypothetical protein
MGHLLLWHAPPSDRVSLGYLEAQDDMFTGHAKLAWQCHEIRKCQVKALRSLSCKLHDHLIVPTLVYILYLTRLTVVA